MCGIEVIPMSDQDRRVRRTRRNLHEALIAMILERGYEYITVQDILDRADVGRSTFYAHFRDKEALLLSSFDDLRADLQRDIDALTPAEAPANPGQPSTVLFAHAYRHRSIYRALCGGKQGGNLVYRHLHSAIGTMLREHLEPHMAAVGSRLPVDLVSEFHASALLGMLTWWVEHDFPYGPAEMARTYGALAVPGLLAALNGSGNPRPGVWGTVEAVAAG
jgi:AcrR family transcriptional regulator